MIGIIVTGHNHVASGLVSGMNLIAGEQEKCEVVDYLEEYTPEDFDFTNVRHIVGTYFG